MASAKQAAKALNELSQTFCEEDSLAYGEVLEDYFLNDDGQGGSTGRLLPER